MAESGKSVGATTLVGGATSGSIFPPPPNSGTVAYHRESQQGVTYGPRIASGLPALGGPAASVTTSAAATVQAKSHHNTNESRVAPSSQLHSDRGTVATTNGSTSPEVMGAGATAAVGTGEAVGVSDPPANSERIVEDDRHTDVKGRGEARGHGSTEGTRAHTQTSSPASAQKSQPPAAESQGLNADAVRTHPPTPPQSAPRNDDIITPGQNSPAAVTAQARFIKETQGAFRLYNRYPSTESFMVYPPDGKVGDTPASTGGEGPAEGDDSSRRPVFVWRPELAFPEVFEGGRPPCPRCKTSEYVVSKGWMQHGSRVGVLQNGSCDLTCYWYQCRKCQDDNKRKPKVKCSAAE